MQPDLLTIPEFCEVTNVCKTLAYRFINNGSLKAVKVGKKTLITQKAKDAWLASLPAYQSYPEIIILD